MTSQGKTSVQIVRCVISALLCTSLANAPIMLAGCAQQDTQETAASVTDNQSSTSENQVSKSILDSWHAVYAYVNTSDSSKQRAYDEDALKLVHLDLAIKIAQDDSGNTFVTISKGSDSTVGMIDVDSIEKGNMKGLESTAYGLQDSNGISAYLLELADYDNTLIYVEDDNIYFFARDNAEQDNLSEIKSYF